MTANKLDASTPHEDFEGQSETQKASIVLSQKAQKQFHNKVPGVSLFKPDNEIFYTGKWLVPGVQQKYAFNFHPPLFWMNGVGEEGRLTSPDLEMTFVMCQMNIDPTLYKQISENRHIKRIPAQYATVRHDTVEYTLGTGQTRFEQDKIFNGRIPDRMVVGLLHPDSYNGNYAYHPFAFQKFGIKDIKQLI